MTAPVELSPCPFCGSKIVGPLTESEVRDPATGAMVPDPHARLGVVGCGVCGAEGPSLYDPPEEFIAKWNQRAEDGVRLAADSLTETVGQELAADGAVGPEKVRGLLAEIHRLRTVFRGVGRLTRWAARAGVAAEDLRAIAVTCRCETGLEFEEFC